MLPKRTFIYRITNDAKQDSNGRHFSVFQKYHSENRNFKINELSHQNDELMRHHSPLILKRSSLIKYDDCIPFADGNDTNDRILKETNEVQSDDVDKQQYGALFKTVSISSLKLSSLKEQWPSSEYVQAVNNKNRTQSTSDEHRCPLPSTVSQMNTIKDPCSSIIRSSVCPPSQSDTTLSLSSDKTSLANCLSKCDDGSKSAASEIMKQMDFTGTPLVESLQNFIKKIPVIGESQERDRILNYFSTRYMECNPCAFKNNDCCHTLVCALMLLNTDIHGQVSKKRMTCKEFVDNIITNYPENDYKESDLINVYSFIRKSELKMEETTDSTTTLRRKISQLISKSIWPPQEMNSVNIDPSTLNQQHFMSGNIMRKCIKRPFGKKPALGHRGWKLQFASLIGLQLLLFKTNLNKNDNRIDRDDHNGDKISLTDSNISSELLQNDDSSISICTSNVTRLGESKMQSSCSRDNIQVSVDDVESCIKIHHAFASVVEKLRHKNVFSLRLADEAEFFFKVKSDQLCSWVNSINYASAMLSAPPIVGAGQSGLYKPLLPGYLTDCNKADQLQSHETQVKNYGDSLKKLQLVNSKARAINEPNIQFCKYEINRFETYAKLLRLHATQEPRTGPSLLQPDQYSNLSSRDIFDHKSNMTESPRSAFHTYSNPTEPAVQDGTTLRRRPPKVPTVCRAAPRPSIHPCECGPMQFSATTDSLHNFLVPQNYIPLSRRPTPYSPQMSSHSLMIHSVGVRPTPSFSRFIEPSFANNFEQAPSPMSTARSQHSCQSPFVEVSASKLPQYSPPSARHGTNKA